MDKEKRAKIKEDKKAKRLEKRYRTPGIAASVVYPAIFLIGIVLLIGSVWYQFSFGMGFKELIYTLLSPLKGTESGMVTGVLKACLPPIIILFAAYLTAFIVTRKNKSGKEKEPKPKVTRQKVNRWLRVTGVVTLVVSILYAFFALGVAYYLIPMIFKSKIYEERYVEPDTVEIIAQGETKNLIYIYLESMETTYASREVGGYQDINYMPRMTGLAKDNLTFSDKADPNEIGGFRCPAGTGWTIGSILATTSGIPFSFPVGGDNMSSRATFAPGLTNLGDILEGYGYTSEFLCGSDADFAGRRNYFEQHGNYRIFDYFTAIEKGYIAEDYKVWWGFEDEILYKIAKDELTSLASEDAPFNFAMLTVDTHPVEGYMCGLCEDKYDCKTANVVECADRQLTEFVEWIKEQDFFEDTVVIITGDHPRTDKMLVSGIDFYDRTVYNCIINSDTAVKGPTTGRIYTPMDMFPTTLEAMGFDVEGDRLGLGVSMFSDQPTLAEELGYGKFENEISRYSDYYNKFSEKRK